MAARYKQNLLTFLKISLGFGSSLFMASTAFEGYNNTITSNLLLRHTLNFRSLMAPRLGLGFVMSVQTANKQLSLELDLLPAFTLAV
jgi:hypothetical protein